MPRPPKEGAVYLQKGRSPFYRMWYRDDCDRCKAGGRHQGESTGKRTKTEAWEVLRQKLRDIATGVHVSHADKVLGFEEAANLWLDHQRLRGCRLAPMQDHVARLLRFAGDIPLVAFDATRWDRYLEQMLETEYLPGKRYARGTLNGDRSALLSIFARACDIRRIAANAIPNLHKLEHATKRRRGDLSREQFAAFLKRFDELGAYWARRIATFEGWSAWRVSEVVKLLWSNIDRGRQIITLTQHKVVAKTGRDRVFYYGTLPVVKALIEEMAADCMARGRMPVGDTPVFTRDGEPVTLNVYRGWFEHAAGRRDASFRYIKGSTGIRTHDMRRMGVTNLRAAGVPDHIICQIAGMSMQMLQWYTQPRVEEQAEAGEKLTAFHSRGEVVPLKREDGK